jgi:hypothetical protein
MHPRAAQPEGLGDILGVPARIPRPHQPLRKSIENGAIATSIRSEEYHGHRAMYKLKTL